MENLKNFDQEIFNAIGAELRRQKNTIELIASENFVSRAVLEAAGSVLTNKYAEGYPGKRYYGGCECVDIAEKLAIERVKLLFSAEHANVQPHSGAQANEAVYFAFLRPGDTVLGMNLSHGGHLTHGSPVNISGSYYNFVAYGVNPESFTIDYEEVRKIALKHKPKMLVAGASAYSREINFAKLSEISKEIGAIFMVDMAHIAGLVATGLHQSPVPFSDVVTSTTHKTLRGIRGAFILCKTEHAAKIDKAVFPGMQGGPLMHIIAAKAVGFKEALQPEFKEYQKQIVKNAKTLANTLVEEGFTILSGGTDNHLMLMDVRSVNLTGKEAENLLGECGITVNKNAIPFDTASPFITSGIRLGTPACTTRGLVERDMFELAKIFKLVLRNPHDENIKKEVKIKVEDICKKYPLYA